MESRLKDQGRHEQAKHQTRRQFQVHTALHCQHQPGRDQRHRIGKTHAANGQRHQQNNGQNLYDFKFQL